MKFIAAVRCLAFAVFALANTSALADEGYDLANGVTANISSPDGTCRKVTNNTGMTLHVTNYSNAEFYSDANSFVNHPPANVTIAACAATCTWEPNGTGIAAGGSCPLPNPSGNPCTFTNSFADTCAGAVYDYSGPPKYLTIYELYYCYCQ